MSDTSSDEGDRGASPVLRKRKKSKLLSGKYLACAGVALFAGAFIWRNLDPSTPPEKPHEKLPATLGSTVSYVEPKMPVMAAPPPTPAALPQQLPPQLIMPQTDPGVRIARAAVAPPPPPPAPNLISYNDPVTPKPTPAAGAGISGSDQPSSVVKYAATSILGIKAGSLGDQTFLLTPMVLPCILDTAIDSQIAGPVSCHVHGDIRPHGVTLLDDGSVIHGMASGTVQNGQTRLAIAADWIEDRTTGCAVQLDNAPFSDGLGTSGVAGNVDNHTWERFGAAVLMTVGDSSVQLAQTLLQKQGNSYLSFNGGSGVQSLAETILQKQIGIQPTITIPQGTPIAVFVQKVLDFSPCYSLALKGRGQ